MTATADRETIRALFERWIQQVHVGDQLDLVPDCVAPIYIRHERGETRQVTPESYGEEIRALHARLHRWAVQVHDLAIEGDRCWWRGTWSAIDTATGEPFTLADLAVYRTEDGKLAETWQWSTAGFGSTWPEYQASAEAPAR